VTVLLESASRSVLGMAIGFDPPNSDSVLRCMQHAMSPKDLSGYRFDDGRPIFTKKWSQLGPVRLVKSDLGKDFLSKHARDAIYRCGSNLLPLKPRRPTLKGKVERFIKSVKYGPVGAELGILPRRLRRKVSTGEVLLVTLEQLWLILAYWIVEVYHQEEHGALGMPPQEAWDTLTARTRIDPPPSPEDLALIVGKYETGTLNRNGIRHDGLEYNSPEFGALRERCADPDGTMDVEFKKDPANIDTIWVLAEDPDRRGRVIAVPGYCKQMPYARGLSEYRHHVIQAFARENARGRRVTVHQLMDAKLKLAELARTMFEERKNRFGTVNVGRYLKAGRSYLLDPTELPEDAGDAERQLEIVDERLARDDETAEETPSRPRRESQPKAIRGTAQATDNPPPDAVVAADPDGVHVRRKLGTLRRG